MVHAQKGGLFFDTQCTRHTALRAPKQASWDRLHSSMVSKDTDRFRKSWISLNSKNKSNHCSVVDGVSSKEDIADAFKNSFQNAAKPNNNAKISELNERFKTKYEAYCHEHGVSCNCLQYKFTMNVVIDVILSIKVGKCADAEGISAEHFLNAPFFRGKSCKMTYGKRDSLVTLPVSGLFCEERTNLHSDFLTLI
jgi:hypothetical protein